MGVERAETGRGVRGERSEVLEAAGCQAQAPLAEGTAYLLSEASLSHFPECILQDIDVLFLTLVFTSHLEHLGEEVWMERNHILLTTSRNGFLPTRLAVL